MQLTQSFSHSKLRGFPVIYTGCQLGPNFSRLNMLFKYDIARLNFCYIYICLHEYKTLQCRYTWRYRKQSMKTKHKTLQCRYTWRYRKQSMKTKYHPVLVFNHPRRLQSSLKCDKRAYRSDDSVTFIGYSYSYIASHSICIIVCDDDHQAEWFFARYILKRLQYGYDFPRAHYIDTYQIMGTVSAVFTSLQGQSDVRGYGRVLPFSYYPYTTNNECAYIVPWWSKLILQI